MIDIVRFRELLLELRQTVNKQLDTPINEVVLAVREGHMQKKLKDKDGICLCSNYPNAELNGSEDSHKENNKVLLFVLDKVSSGGITDEEEIQHYANIQRIMQLVKSELISMGFACGELGSDDGMLTEWEFDIFGGFNGLSIGFNLVDYD